MTYYVVCINKHPYHTDPHTRIENIGTNEKPESASCSRKWSVPQVIAAIGKDDVFYSKDAKGDTAKLIIATHLGHEYVKSENDGIQPDNLLAKPECPQ